MVRLDKNGNAIRKIGATVSSDDYARVQRVIVKRKMTLQDWFMSLIWAELEKEEEE